jgi:hypothetical protein
MNMEHFKDHHRETGVYPKGYWELLERSDFSFRSSFSSCWQGVAGVAVHMGVEKSHFWDGSTGRRGL